MCCSPHGATERSMRRRLGVRAHEEPEHAERHPADDEHDEREREEQAGLRLRVEPAAPRGSGRCVRSGARPRSAGRADAGSIPGCRRTAKPKHAPSEQRGPEQDERDEQGRPPGDVTSFTSCLPAPAGGETLTVDTREQAAQVGQPRASGRRHRGHRDRRLPRRRGDGARAGGAGHATSSWATAWVATISTSHGGSPIGAPPPGTTSRSSVRTSPRRSPSWSSSPSRWSCSRCAGTGRSSGSWS